MLLINDPATIESVLDAGAWGFVSKSAGPERLVGAVRRVAAGEVCAAGMG